jgi:hypothetical protein
MEFRKNLKSSGKNEGRIIEFEVQPKNILKKLRL